MIVKRRRVQELTFKRVPKLFCHDIRTLPIVFCLFYTPIVKLQCGSFLHDVELFRSRKQRRRNFDEYYTPTNGLYLLNFDDWELTTLKISSYHFAGVHE